MHRPWGRAYLFRLIAEHGAPPQLGRLVVSAVLSGLSSILVLALVNVAAQEIGHSDHDTVNWLLAGLFVAALLVYVVADFYLLSRVGYDAEAAIHGIRVSLLDRLRRCNYQQLEAFGRARLYESITQSTQTISQISQYLAIAFRSAILAVAIIIYLGWVSMVALALVLSTLLMGGWLFHRLDLRLKVRFTEVLAEEGRVFEAVSDLLDGFKEVRMSSARSHELAAVFAATNRQVTEMRTKAQYLSAEKVVFGQLAVFLLLAVVVFIVPQYSATFTDDIMEITTAVLFMLGPVGVLIQSLTLLSSAEAAAARMLELDSTLAGMEAAEYAVAPRPLALEFAEIRMEGVEFTHPVGVGEQPFSVGPVDLTLKRGDLVFITGGNGSGKTTLLRLFTGLYSPQRGRLVMDGIPVVARTVPAYRALMSTVFSDYHLFDRLYGLEDVAQERIWELLRWMELIEVTGIHEGAFDTLDLSAGQRKRLALIIALLEGRSILVLDEWAADQDPLFRRKFYREVLPALKEQGKTIIAVTHDDHYFDVPDRRLHMEEGRISEVAPAGAGS